MRTPLLLVPVLLLGACSAGGTAAVETVTMTETVAASSTPTSASSPATRTTSTPEPTASEVGLQVPPLDGFVENPDSLHSVPEQQLHYLIEVSTGYNVQEPDFSFIPAAIVLCDDVIFVDGDKELYQQLYDAQQRMNQLPPEVPLSFVALAASITTCPEHKEFILDFIEDQI